MTLPRKEDSMCYVVLEATKEILFRIDAWELHSVDKAIGWAEANGYKIVKDEITLMGDMVLWVKEV